MMRIIRLISLFTLLLAACKKTPETNSSIRGRIVDGDTRQPIRGATVSGRYIGGKAGFGPNFNIADLESVKTDANGYFALEFYARSDGSGEDRYQISSDMNGYFGSAAEFIADSINNKVTNQDFIFRQQIDFTIKVRHAGAASPDDGIMIDVLYYPYSGSLSITSDGTVAERESRYFTVPTHPTVFHYVKWRNGVYSPAQTDSVMITQNNAEHVLEF